MRIRTRKVLFVAAFISLTSAAHAQLTSGTLEAAAVGAFDSVPANQVPANATFYSWQLYWQPPLPSDRFPDLTVYDLGGGRYLIDDRLVEYPSPSAGTNTPVKGPTPGVQNPMSEGAYGCALWLQINPSTNNRVLLTVHNTRQGQSYQIWSSTNLSTTNWVAEMNLTGASGNFTQTLISMTNRPMAFFEASETRDYSVDTNSTFTGLGFSDTGLEVPDSMGAVGPNHFVELLNGMIAVYSKNGTLVARTNTTEFFRINISIPTASGMVDGRILYDHRSQCWIALALDRGTHGDVLLAVNTNTAPTNLASGWTRYFLQMKRSDNYFADFPTLGLDDNGLYVSVLHLSNSSVLAGHTVMAIKKPEIYRGMLITNRVDLYAPTNLPVWIIQPVVNFDPVATNNYAWFVAKGPPDLGTNYRGGAVCYRRLQWTGTNASMVDYDWVAVTNATSNYRDYYDLDGTNVTMFPVPLTGVSAPHRLDEFESIGDPIDLHVTGSRLAMTVIRDGNLWTCQTIGLSGTNGAYSGNAAGTNVDRSGLQWIKMRVEPGGVGLAYETHGRVYDPRPENPHYYYFGSLMVNCPGDMAMGFSGSTVTNYISAFYVTRPAGNASGGSPRLIREGISPFILGSRWGDYSATTLDPADAWSFWSVQEYAGVVSSNAWHTIVTRIRPQP